MIFGHGKPLIAFVLGIELILLASSFLFANALGRAITDKTVSGIVQDQTGVPLSGASVTVEIWGGYWPDQDFFRTSESTYTDSSGYYEVTINSNYWDPHNTIKVIATYGGYERSRMVEANGDAYQTVNITIVLSIPELGGTLGMLAMLAGCIVPVVLRSSRGRRKLDDRS